MYASACINTNLMKTSSTALCCIDNSSYWCCLLLSLSDCAVADLTLTNIPCLFMAGR